MCIGVRDLQTRQIFRLCSQLLAVEGPGHCWKERESEGRTFSSKTLVASCAGRSSRFAQMSFGSRKAIVSGWSTNMLTLMLALSGRRGNASVQCGQNAGRNRTSPANSSISRRLFKAALANGNSAHNSSKFATFPRRRSSIVFHAS